MELLIEHCFLQNIKLHYIFVADMDFSLINRSDDINLQLSTPSIRYEAQIIRTLIDNIEAIEAQLTKALRESRFMRKNEAASKDKTLYDTESKRK